MPVAYLKRVLAIRLMTMLVIFLLASEGTAFAQTRTISFRNMHTNETLTVEYMRSGRHIPDAMQKINHILRDWRRNESIRMNPKLIDLIYDVHQATGSSEPINVVSGYRSPVTNAALRSRSSGVARNSQHILGNATDLYFPDVSVAKIREVALRFERGGVGYYPRSGRPFVHLDVGNVRHWPRMTPQQLARVFPDGNTQHIPSNGRPLPRTAPSTEIRTTSVDTAAPSAATSPSQQIVTPTPDAATIVVANTRSSNGNDVTALAQDTGRFRIASLFGADSQATSIAENTQSASPDTSDEPPITIDVAALQVPVSRPVSGDANTNIPGQAQFQLAALLLPSSRPEYTASIAPANSANRRAGQTDELGQIILASLPGPGSASSPYSNSRMPQYHETQLNYHQPVVDDLVTTDRAEGMSFASFTAPDPTNMRELVVVGSGAIALSFTAGRLGNAASNRVFEGPAVRALQVAFAS